MMQHEKSDDPGRKDGPAAGSSGDIADPLAAYSQPSPRSTARVAHCTACDVYVPQRPGDWEVRCGRELGMVSCGGCLCCRADSCMSAWACAAGASARGSVAYASIPRRAAGSTFCAAHRAPPYFSQASACSRAWLPLGRVQRCLQEAAGAPSISVYKRSHLPAVPRFMSRASATAASCSACGRTASATGWCCRRLRACQVGAQRCPPTRPAPSAQAACTRHGHLRGACWMGGGLASGPDTSEPGALHSPAERRLRYVPASCAWCRVGRGGPAAGGGQGSAGVWPAAHGGAPGRRPAGWRCIRLGGALGAAAGRAPAAHRGAEAAAQHVWGWAG